MMGEIFKVAGLMLFSSVKFLFAPSTVFFSGFNYFETIIITILGGWLGVFVFFYAGTYVVNWSTMFADWVISLFKDREGEKKKKVFSKRNRVIIDVKNRYGIIGLAIISPSLISIPLGCFIAAKYFRHDKRTIPVFLAAVVFWSFTLTTLSAVVGPSIF